ncbi:hypothetical protein ACUXV3_12220 [Roseobacteraceae bacterium NS-SX3]
MTPLYHYHPVTGEFSGQSEARPDPRTGNPMVPGNATLQAPPELQEGYARVFTEGAWQLVEDHRGTVIWSADGQEIIVTGLGPLPEGVLTERPVLPLYPTLESAQAAMANWIDGFLQQVSGRVPEFERASWPAKAAAARAIQAGTATGDQTALVLGEADVVGETIEETAALIVENAAPYEVIIGKATGLRRVLNAQLEAAADPLEYEAILEAGRDQALALAADLGIGAAE